MSRKSVATALLLALVFAIAPAAGAAGPPGSAAPGAGFRVEVEQVGEPLLASVAGASRASCVGAVIGFSLAALTVGAFTGGIGLAIAGAYAPALTVLCI